MAICHNKKYEREFVKLMIDFNRDVSAAKSYQIKKIDSGFFTEE